MRKLFKVVAYFFLTLLLLILVIVIGFHIHYSMQHAKYMKKAGPEAPSLSIDGLTFRDLNKNGILDVYEDYRQEIEARISDLLAQMTIAEKAGTMFHTMIAMGSDGELLKRPSPNDPISFASPVNSQMILGKLMNHFNVFFISDPKAAALWHNKLQKLAERTRLGIPVSISSDPRHAFSSNPGASALAGAFSKWPESTGLAATRDSALVTQFGDIARQEYLAVGIRIALHPMADLATEPRWGRINGTFGEDAELASLMVRAYIRGFQGAQLGAASVACMTKHFSGGGPQADGLDAHFEYGKDQAYPGNNFDYHLLPFERGAFVAQTAQIMPYYGIPVGQTAEDVGFAFNKEVITGLLRERYGFDGVVCTDWGVLSARKILGREIFPSTGWGVSDLTVEERIVKALDAGVDQFGGESATELLIKLVESGQVTEGRLDISVRRILRDKFRLGLFDNPYLAVENTSQIVGRKDFMEAGALAQRKSIVLLKNSTINGAPVLPLKSRPKIYIENIDPSVASQYAVLVKNPEEADLAILRLNAPYQNLQLSNSFLENFFHQGDLDFKEEEKNRILNILQKVPTIIDIYLDRPAVIPEIADKSMALLANFGAEDDALLDIVFGKFNPQAKLPFELPSSMEAVRNQKEDVPYDSADPLFSFGFGLTY